MSEKTPETTVEKKCKFDQIKVGDYLSETQYYEVFSVSDKEIAVRNARGLEMDVDRGIVEEGMYTCNQFAEEVKVSRTEMCEILEKVGDAVFTVNFNKQVKDKEVTDAIMKTLLEEEEVDEAQLSKLVKKSVKDALKGQERTLIGFLIQSEPKMGRSQVVDLQIPEGKSGVRLVDHRTMNWLIVKNVKYSLK